MNIFQVDEEKFNEILNDGMRATIKALRDEGGLSAEVASEFLDTHACIRVYKSPVWNRILIRLGLGDFEKDHYAAVVMRLTDESK